MEGECACAGPLAVSSSMSQDMRRGDKHAALVLGSEMFSGCQGIVSYISVP